MTRTKATPTYSASGGCYWRHVTPRTRTTTTLVLPGDPDYVACVVALWLGRTEDERRQFVWGQLGFGCRQLAILRAEGVFTDEDLVRYGTHKQ